MTPAALQDGEVQYYTSPILVKNNRYYATLTNLRLIVEGATVRDFKVTSIRGAFPELVGNKEPGLKISISTPTGHKDMIWTFPLDDLFKKAEQEAWIEAVKKVVGEKPFAMGTVTPEYTQSTTKFNDTAPVGAAAGTGIAVAVGQQTPIVTETTAPAFIKLIRGETVAVSTAGVRIKHTFYTAYLTNLRLVLQNKLGKIGREFAIAELVDTTAIEGDAGEPEIAISISIQGGIKQMIMVYPTASSRDAWRQQLQNKLAQKTAPHPSPAVANRLGTFVPATNERVIVTIPSVLVKNRPVIIHLTNTRFVVDSANGVIGDFAISTIIRFSRMTSELGEYGISMRLGSTSGEREMYLIFSSMNDREAWMNTMHSLVPGEPQSSPGATVPYTITTVTPRPQTNTQTMRCPNCGATNPVSEERCALCGSSLHQQPRQKSSRYEEDESEWPPQHRSSRSRREYSSGVIGFITCPRDAFEYYVHESPAGPFSTFLVTGAIWAIITTIFVVYILPHIFNVNAYRFPIFAGLESNILLLIIFVVILWIIWMVVLMVYATITSAITHLFETQVRISEVVAITMWCSLTFAVCGWLFPIGTISASIWTVIETIYGLKLSQNTSSAGSIIAPIIGMLIIYVVLFLIGGGFS